MSQRSVLWVCIIVVLSIVSAPAALADIIIMADQSCRTTVTDPDTNNHNSTKLSIRSDEKSSKSWIKFNISGLNVKDLEAATLTVTLIEAKDSDRHFDVSYVNDDCRDNIDWDDRSITWDNAPGNNTADFGGLDPSKTTFLTTVNFTNGVVGQAFTINVLEALLTDTDGIVQFVCHNSNGLLQLGTHDHPDEAWRPFIDATLVAKGQAKRPSPAKGETDVSATPVLSWTPGENADKHNVYFGTGFDDVNSAGAGSPLLVSPAQDAATYDPGRLEFGQTYYWRIDEIEANGSTIHKGSVWSFTVEPLAYLIPGGNITATASSQAPDQGPEKTVDGSGLVGNLHSTVLTDMWLSAAGQPAPAWIQYDFDKAYKLHEILVWNYNGPSFLTAAGVKDAVVEYSSDGANWTPIAGVTEFARATGLDDYAPNTTMSLADIAGKSVRITANSNWSGGFSDQFGLSEVRFMQIPVSAREPSPADGATKVAVEVTLGWRAGRQAAQHKVYISSDQQAVIDGTALAATVSQAGYAPLSLELGSTYFWRVDEVNEAETPATWQGDVWSFTTADYIAVDDFESYNDIDPPDPASHRIFESWIDGYGVATNGALVGYDPPQPSYAETAIVHEGGQSMPMFYSNTAGATYSQATRTFAASQDWTRHGVKTLTLYFFGTAGNTGQLYVKINGTKVLYNGAAANLAVADWQSWDIDLATVGVNLQSVASLTIGIDGNAAAGTLYFDDIRLH